MKPRKTAPRATAFPRTLRSVIIHAILVAFAALVAFPLFWMVAASFMPRGEAAMFPPRLLPSAPTLAHYGELFTRLNLGRAFLNSAIVASLSTLVSLLFNSMAGYAFAKLRFARREQLFGIMLA
ncbi:MAG TPA: hypothetical protein VLV48_01905, partial [Thermoanaerobaculia bacterium]|nr:hypothetical protein [Thermoanaerobaculia bacterium]